MHQNELGCERVPGLLLLQWRSEAATLAADKCSPAVPGNVGHEVGAQAVLEQGLLHHYLLKAQRRCVEERGEHCIQDGTVVNVKDGEDFSFDTCDGNA